MSRPRATLGVERMEDRTVPTAVITGTAGNDVIRSQIAPIGGGLFQADILLNGQVVYSWVNNAHPSPVNSVFLPEPLEVYGLGGDDDIDLGQIRDPENVFAPILVRGGAGNDTIKGSFGNDRIFGDAGADRLNGGVDEDTLVGDATDLAFNGGGGVDVLRLEGLTGLTRVTPTALTLNTRVLTQASGAFVNIMGLELIGWDGPNVMDATAFGGFYVRMEGNGGRDQLTASASRVEMFGGIGDDVLTSGAGDDMLFGDEGNDVIRGGAGLNVLYGGAGNDLVDGRAGFGGLFGDAGADTLLGGGGDDNLLGGAGNDILQAGDGNDFLVGEDGDDLLDAGPGVDVLFGDDGADQLIGGPGDDNMNGEAADRRLDAGDGIDVLGVDGLSGTTIATPAGLTVNGWFISAGGVEVLFLTGTATNDTIDASAHPALVFLDGGDGDDTLRLSVGGGQAFGGFGADALFGGPATDDLFGDADDVSLLAGGGANFVGIEGITGTAVATDTGVTVNGRLIPINGAATLRLSGNDGDDTSDASAFTGAVVLLGGGGNDTLTGSATGANTIFGEDGNDTLIGGSAGDQLFGDEGDDRLEGRGGDDELTGANGLDTLLGGPGADLFYQDNDPMVAMLEQAAWDFNTDDGDLVI